MRYLKTNTATSIVVGPFLDSTDGVTPETSLTVTGIHATLVVDNAGTPTLALDADLTASGGNNDCAHITNDDAGMYSMELAAANVNYLGGAILTLVVSGACPVFHEFTILPALVYDSLISGSDNLQVDGVQMGGTTLTGRDIGASVLISSGTGTGQLSVSSGVIASNVTQMGGAAQSATDLKDFADTGYDPATHKVQGVVLADTVTTYTGNTPQTGDSFARIGATGSGLTSLAQAADLSTDAEIADAVWDEVLSGHAGAGSAGEALAAAGTAGDPWTTDLPGSYTGTQAGKMLSDVLTDTADMQPKLGTPAGASISADIAAIEAQTDDIGIAGAGLTALGDTRIANLDATISSRASQTSVNTIDDFLDTEIAAILEDTGTTLPATLANLALESTAQSILTDTAEIGTAGAGLTNINLPDQTMNITGNITGNLSGSVGSVTGAVGSVTGAVGSVTGAVGSVTGAVGSVTGNVGGNVTGSIGSLATQAKADVNAEVVDVLRTDTLPDSVATDGSASTIAQAMYLILQFLTEKSVTSTTMTVKKPDGSTTLATFTLNDASAPTAITRAT